MAGPEFNYEDLLPIGADETEYRKISSEGVSTFKADGMEFL
jgi:fumarate hydratase class I